MFWAANCSSPRSKYRPFGIMAVPVIKPFLPKRMIASLTELSLPKSSATIASRLLGDWSTISLDIALVYPVGNVFEQYSVER